MDFTRPNSIEIAAYHARVYADDGEFVPMSHQQILDAGIALPLWYKPDAANPSYRYVQNAAGHIAVHKVDGPPDGAREKVATRLGHMLDAAVMPVLLTHEGSALGPGVLSLVKDPKAVDIYSYLRATLPADKARTFAQAMDSAGLSLSYVHEGGVDAIHTSARWNFGQRLLMQGTENNRVLNLLVEATDVGLQKHYLVATAADGSLQRYQIDLAASLEGVGDHLTTDPLGWKQPSDEYIAKKISAIDPVDMLAAVYDIPLEAWREPEYRQRAIDTLCINYERFTGHDVPASAFRMIEMRVGPAPAAANDSVAEELALT